MLNKKMDATRRIPTPHILILLVALLMIMYLTAAFWEYTQDDVFITYVYSRNVAQGDGFIFNTGQYVQGTTTPLWTLLMAGVYNITHDLLHAGNFLSAVCLFGVVILALHILENHLGWLAKLFLALTLAVSPLVYVSYGMETLFYCTLLLIGFCLWVSEKPILAMFTAGLLTLVRADGVVLAGTFGLLGLITWRNVLDKRLWRMSLVYLATIAPWFVFAWLYFGTPLPNTLNAKEETFEGIRFLRDGRTWFLNFYGENNPIAEIAVLFVGIGLVQAFRTPALRMLAIWACAYTLGYTILNVATFWYYTPLFVVLVMLMAIGAQWFGTQLLRRFQLPQVVQIGLAGLFILVCTGLAIDRAHDFNEPPPRVATYILAGDWIREHTPEDSTLLVGDLGIVGYHAERYTYDSPGLVTPELAFVNNDAYAVAKIKPDYVLATRYFSWQQVTQAEWFNALYRPVAQFSTSSDTFSPMTLYERRFPNESESELIEGETPFVECNDTLLPDEPVPTHTNIFTGNTNNLVSLSARTPFLAGQYPTEFPPQPDTVVDIVPLPSNIAPQDLYTYCGGAIGETLGKKTSFTRIIPISEAEDYQPLTGIHWEDSGELEGFRLPQTQTWSGGEVELWLDWELAPELNPDFTVFVHLVNSNGVPVAQKDGVPTYHVDNRRIQLPANLPAGEYHVRVGWYNWRTEERILLTDGTDYVELPIVIENRFPGGSGLP